MRRTATRWIEPHLPMLAPSPIRRAESKAEALFEPCLQAHVPLSLRAPVPGRPPSKMDEPHYLLVRAMGHEFHETDCPCHVADCASACVLLGLSIKADVVVHR